MQYFKLSPFRFFSKGRKVRKKCEAFPYVKASPCRVFATAKIGKNGQPLRGFPSGAFLAKLPPYGNFGGLLSTKLTDEGQFHSKNKNKNKFTHGLNHAGANQLRYARRRKIRAQAQKTQIFPRVSSKQDAKREYRRREFTNGK